MLYFTQKKNDLADLLEKEILFAEITEPISWKDPGLRLEEHLW